MSNVTQDGLMEELVHYARRDLVEHMGDLIDQLRNRIADLERKCYRLEDDIRNVRYTAEEADSKAGRAEDEARRAQRGW